MSFINNLRLEWKLRLIAAVALLALVLVGLLGVFVVTSLNDALGRVSVTAAALRNHMACDMKHDAIRGDAVRLASIGDPAKARGIIQDLRQHAAEFRALLREGESAALEADQQRVLSGVRPAVETYLSAADAFAAVAERTPQGVGEALPVLERHYFLLEEPMARAADVLQASVEGAAAAADQTVRASLWELSLVALLALVVVAGLARQVHVSLDAPIRTAAEVLSGLARGDLSRRVDIQRNDEIGQMAAALDGAQLALSEVVDELRGLILASREGRLGVRSAEGRFQGVFAELVAGMNALLESSSEPIRVILGSTTSLAAASAQLTSISATLNESAELTSSQVSSVADAARQVAGTAQSLASSTEQMGATIHEVARNAADSAQVAGQAVCAAETTNAAVAELGQSAAKIGKVIKVITAIAQQTNLLALNATIEAARAGESGKGFAVVANEVKELAKETAKATEDIGHSVASIQNDTERAVSAIATINAIIGKINDMSNAIAGAVEEQSATTNEMNRHVIEVAGGSMSITDSIGSVSSAARSTAAGASQTEYAAQTLARVVAELERLTGKYSFDTAAVPVTPGDWSRAGAPLERVLLQ